MKQAPISIAVVLFFVLCSFGGTKTFKRTSWIPEDFDCRKSVLLVQKPAFDVSEKREDKLQADMQEIMQNEYPYKYQFASTQEITDVKNSFKDTDKYRWALRLKTVTLTSTSGMVVNAMDFYIYDRKTNKEYESTGYNDSFLKHIMTPTIATIVKHLKELK